MDYLHSILLKNNYPDWIIKNLEKKPATHPVDPNTGLKSIKYLHLCCICSWPQWRIQKSLLEYQCTGHVQKTSTLTSILMHPNDKMPSQIKQNMVYKWSFPEENFNLSDIG